MHKGVILIVKAENRIEANEAAESFLEQYGEGDVWDWQVIGGRWTGLLDGYDPQKDPKNYATCKYCGGTGDRKDLAPPSWKKECGGCNACHGTGKALNFSYAPHKNDIMPLAKCIEAVKEYAEGVDKEEQEYSERIKEYATKGDRMMQGYCLKRQGELIAQDFCFDCNVYNVEKEDYSIPTDPEGFWAVVVDMHN